MIQIAYTNHCPCHLKNMLLKGPLTRPLTIRIKSLQYINRRQWRGEKKKGEEEEEKEEKGDEERGGGRRKEEGEEGRRRGVHVTLQIQGRKLGRRKEEGKEKKSKTKPFQLQYP